LYRVTVHGDMVAVELSIRAHSSARWRHPRAPSSRPERRSTSHAATSGTCATGRSRCSTATRCSA
jgi:hypothetical protein